MQDNYKISDFVYFRVNSTMPWQKGLYMKYEGNEYIGHLVRNAAGTIFVIRTDVDIKLAECLNA